MNTETFVVVVNVQEPAVDFIAKSKSKSGDYCECDKNDAKKSTNLFNVEKSTSPASVTKSEFESFLL